MEKNKLKQVILEQEKAKQISRTGLIREKMQEVEAFIHLPHVVIISGIRRCGKSTLLMQILSTHYQDNIYYLDFEDERLVGFGIDDFNTLYEIFLELYGVKDVFFFDEVQIIPEWELFVRRMYKEKNKFFITGSNASLLSSELSSRLTGRHIVIELLPFSFLEYLKFHNVTYNDESFYVTKEKSNLKKHFNEYVCNGGMPEFLEHRNPIVLQSTYENILYKDVIVRYEIKAVKAMRELALYLISNIGTLISYTKLKNTLGLGSVNTIKNYIHYLESAYLIFTLDRYSHSLNQQTVSQKKVYSIDTGFVKHIAFQISDNLGRCLENIVYLELRRRYKEIFYYKTDEGLEVDFLIRKGTKVESLIQVTQSLRDPKTRDREVKALLKAMQELSVGRGLILTLDDESIDFGDTPIHVLSIYRWLLTQPKL